MSMAGAGAAAGASTVALLGKFTSFLGDAVKALNEIVVYESTTTVTTEYPATKKGRRVTKTVTRPVKVTLLEVLIGLVIVKIIIYDSANDEWTFADTAREAVFGPVLGPILGWINDSLRPDTVPPIPKDAAFDWWTATRTRRV